jgi:hypothetical protein
MRVANTGATLFLSPARRYFNVTTKELNNATQSFKIIAYLYNIIK